ncbi:hypothetical protein F4680DRAFT_418743 [Xylaria scruposa]|nr:hypothetical protein F4680DRAFT_418743 [Xylaria scruposa]
MSTTQNEVTDHYAPNWLPYFSSNGDSLVRFNVECQMCDKCLAISQPTEAVSFCVLPCGHAFGYKCAVTWINGTSRTCPTCRFSLVYSGCGHEFTPSKLKLADGINMRDAISECIGLPEKCSSCRHKQSSRTAKEGSSNTQTPKAK